MFGVLIMKNKFLLSILLMGILGGIIGTLIFAKITN